MYILEAEEVSDKKNNARQANIFKKIANFFKRIIEKVKGLFSKGKKDVEAVKDMNLKGTDTESENAIKRMTNFFKKNDVTEKDIEQANKDVQIIKEIPNKEKTLGQRYKEELKTTSGKIKMAICGTTLLYNLYMVLIGNKRQMQAELKTAEEMEKCCDAGLSFDSKEVKKIMNAKAKRMIMPQVMNVLTVVSNILSIRHDTFRDWASDKLDKSGRSKLSKTYYKGDKIVKAMSATGAAANIGTSILGYHNMRKLNKKTFDDRDNKTKDADNIVIDQFDDNIVFDESAYDIIMKDIDLI